MTTLDLRTQLKPYYTASAKKVSLVDVPEFRFLTLSGEIETGEGPSTSASFQDNVQAMYAMAYTLKFMSKLRKVDPMDYPVMALEGLWGVKNGEFRWGVKDTWVYTLMILQPNHIDGEMMQAALAQLRKKRGDQPAFSQVALTSFCEGPSVQLMHIGPYAAEPASVAKMDAYAHEHHLQMTGKHHEIYMGDPRKANPERLKTILRHPVKASMD